MSAPCDLPPLTIATCDYNRLMLTAALMQRRGDRSMDFLLAELRRATLCRAEDLPEDVVSTNCRVIYRIDGAPAKGANLLVHPEDLRWPGAELSVTTPLGSALLGVRVGDRMPYRSAAGAPEREVVVEAVGWRFLHDMSWRDIRLNNPIGTQSPDEPSEGSGLPCPSINRRPTGCPSGGSS